MTAQVSVLDLPPKNLQHRSAQVRDTFWKEAWLDLWDLYMDLLLHLAAPPQIFQVAEWFCVNYPTPTIQQSNLDGQQMKLSHLKLGWGEELLCWPVEWDNGLFAWTGSNRIGCTVVSGLMFLHVSWSAHFMNMDSMDACCLPDLPRTQ
jgi:hypothetical protein